MNPAALIADAEAVQVSIILDPPDNLIVRSAGPCPEELLAKLKAHKPDLITALSGPRCPTCRRVLDTKRCCWRCCERLCEACGRPTGSAFIATCWPCGSKP